jgi:hypothetical protein
MDNIVAKDGNNNDVTLATKEIAGAHFDKVMPADPQDGQPFMAASESMMRRILAMLMSPLGYDRSIGRQRSTAVIESGTVTTVTTVTTVNSVANLANIDGRNGAMLINQTNLSAWADCVRARIT